MTRLSRSCQITLQVTSYKLHYSRMKGNSRPKRAVTLQVYSLQKPCSKMEWQNFSSTFFLLKGEIMAIIISGTDLAKNIFAVHGVDEAGELALTHSEVLRGKHGKNGAAYTAAICEAAPAQQCGGGDGQQDRELARANLFCSCTEYNHWFLGAECPPLYGLLSVHATSVGRGFS